MREEVGIFLEWSVRKIWNIFCEIIVYTVDYFLVLIHLREYRKLFFFFSWSLSSHQLRHGPSTYFIIDKMLIFSCYFYNIWLAHLDYSQRVCVSHALFPASSVSTLAQQQSVTISAIQQDLWGSIYRNSWTIFISFHSWGHSENCFVLFCFFKLFFFFVLF